MTKYGQFFSSSFLRDSVVIFANLYVIFTKLVSQCIYLAMSLLKFRIANNLRFLFI